MNSVKPIRSKTRTAQANTSGRDRKDAGTAPLSVGSWLSLVIDYTISDTALTHELLKRRSAAPLPRSNQSEVGGATRSLRLSFCGTIGNHASIRRDCSPVAINVLSETHVEREKHKAGNWRSHVGTSYVV
jgi:hypothetical protein